MLSWQIQSPFQYKALTEVMDAALGGENQSN